MEQCTCAIAVYLCCCPCPCTWIQMWRRHMPGGQPLSPSAPHMSQPPVLPWEHGVLGSFWLLGSSQPWSFRLQVAKAQLLHQTKHLVQLVTLPSSVPSHAGMPLGIPCLSVIRFWFLKFALAPLVAICTVSAAGLQATSGQAATGNLSCLLLLAPQPTPLKWPRGISLRPLTAR